jgi:hypothetical protein
MHKNRFSFPGRGVDRFNRSGLLARLSTATRNVKENLAKHSHIQIPTVEVRILSLIKIDHRADTLRISDAPDNQSAMGHCVYSRHVAAWIAALLAMRAFSICNPCRHQSR